MHTFPEVPTCHNFFVFGCLVTSSTGHIVCPPVSSRPSGQGPTRVHRSSAAWAIWPTLPYPYENWHTIQGMYLPPKAGLPTSPSGILCRNQSGTLPRKAQSSTFWLKHCHNLSQMLVPRLQLLSFHSFLFEAYSELFCHSWCTQWCIQHLPP